MNVVWVSSLMSMVNNPLVVIGFICGVIFTTYRRTKRDIENLKTGLDKHVDDTKEETKTVNKKIDDNFKELNARLDRVFIFSNQQKTTVSK